jgi:hypothetical protein
MTQKSIFIKVFRNVKYVFNNVLLLDLESVCLFGLISLFLNVFYFVVCLLVILHAHYIICIAMNILYVYAEFTFETC